MTGTRFRDGIVERLRQDLIGPSSEREVLLDRPTQRYCEGILYPQGSRVEPQEDEDGGLATNVREDAASSPDVSGVSLYASLKPASAGLSFAVVPHDGQSVAAIDVLIDCGIYEQFAVDDSGEEVSGPPSRRKYERWRRRGLGAELRVDLHPGETRLQLDDYGIGGLELYVLVTPRADVLTVTAALSNRRLRGDSSSFDEGQHFFQVNFVIADVINGSFAPRPSKRAEIDEDSRTNALIYRDVKEYVVGHTASTKTYFDETGAVRQLAIEWIPTVVVNSVTDKGDAVFDSLRSDMNDAKPLEAAWLADANDDDLCDGLSSLVAAYRAWIANEKDRVNTLDARYQKQAGKQMERCSAGADRMERGIDAVRYDETVRQAFQLSQRAMDKQFRWTHDDTPLVWRPFQLAFQLLVLSSLQDRDHPDRGILDLLWFPTGGGKTEAYLGLTAFVILLRRLRATDSDDGSGVAVLMRYTLRVLTIQQFQRAAALILACELYRRRSIETDSTAFRLGDSPIGLGLWVGGDATPLTLRDASNSSDSDSSSPKKLKHCPCCKSELLWHISPRECLVECHGSECELSKSGPILPVWTIDEEIYRHAPSLLIGTVDKFAQIVRNLNTRALFGRATNNAPPDLIIQDELHLISGPLGSLAGLYEVAIDELCRQGDIRAKIIGSTATIRRAADQALALFTRETYQFPSPGIDASNSGFAVTDFSAPGRLYVGVTTAGRSATYILQALVASLLQGANDPSAPIDQRDYYWTLVSYFNSLRELGRALILMQDDVPVSISQYAGRRGEDPRNIDAPAELTSRVRSYEIDDMLERLGKVAGDPDAVDLLLASNMISVGMDIPRLGLMVVNAQPKTLSEYIQATSRVGRGSVPGLIVTMYNATRARDRSHYETFETWHRSLYRDVEATSVTPFASRAQDKALHAVLVALVRHTIPGMDRRPVLNETTRARVSQVASLIVDRVQRVDPDEVPLVSQKLDRLIDEWAQRTDLQTYWDDYQRKTSLLMSAEQFAAIADVDPDLETEGMRRALWPAPNSMREVEAGTPFVLRSGLRAEEA